MLLKIDQQVDSSFEKELIEWFCPKCGKKRVYIYYPTFRCAECDTLVPNIQGLIAAQKKRIKYYEIGVQGILCLG